MLLPEVKFEIGQEVIRKFSVESSIISVIETIESDIEKQNPILYNFMLTRSSFAAEYFKNEGDTELTAIAGRLGLCVVYDVISKTCSSKNIPVPYVTNDTIDSFCLAVEKDSEHDKHDSSVAFDFLKKLSVENLTIAKMLGYIANNSPNQLCGETTIVAGAITYFVLGRQLESDLLEMMLE